MRSLDASLEVATFADPVEAIEYARKHRVDMVLTDYKMPNLDGHRDDPPLAPHLRLRRRSDRVHHRSERPRSSATALSSRSHRLSDSSHRPARVRSAVPQSAQPAA